MKKAVMYGAGNIGRGFIGQVLHDSGYRVVFVDTNLEIVDAINKNNCYTQLIVGRDFSRERIIDNVCAVEGGDTQAVIDEISQCDLMAVSVGAGILPRIAPSIAYGIAKRMQENPHACQNILICENIMHSSRVLRDLLCGVQGFDAGYLAQVGLVQTTISRMVPNLSDEIKKGDPTKIAVEPFCQLPMDKDAFMGEIPHIAHAVVYSPFAFYEDKKLLIHNMGHAVTAYLGYLNQYSYLWQAMEDTALVEKVRSAMLCVTHALEKDYRADGAELSVYVEDLLFRFGNKALGDTVARVGQDPMRKLAPGDRFTGALDKCRSQGIPYDPILLGMAAALCFQNAGDTSALKMQDQLRQKGAAEFLRDWSKLQEADIERCVSLYEDL